MELNCASDLTPRHTRRTKIFVAIFALAERLPTLRYVWAFPAKIKFCCTFAKGSIMLKLTGDMSVLFIIEFQLHSCNNDGLKGGDDRLHVQKAGECFVGRVLSPPYY